MSIELVARAKKTRLGGDSTAKLLLIVLADYANDDGMAWPSVATMSAEVEKSERSIQLILRKLEKAGLIRKGDQKLVGKYAKGRRPVVYKLFPTKTKGKTDETPTDDNENRGETHFTTETGFTGETDCTPRVKPVSPHGRNPLHPTGETHCALGVKPISPKPSQEPSIEPSRESTRAHNAKTEPPHDDRADRARALIDLTPDDTHRALADTHGLDLDWELAKFRDRCAATGDYPADPAAALRNWLRRGSELAARPQPQATPTMRLAPDPQPAGAKRHTHTYACPHVLRLLGRDTPDPDELSTHAADLLNQGLDPTAALTRLGLAGDDLDAIA